MRRSPLEGERSVNTQAWAWVQLARKVQIQKYPRARPPLLASPGSRSRAAAFTASCSPGRLRSPKPSRRNQNSLSPFPAAPEAPSPARPRRLRSSPVPLARAWPGGEPGRGRDGGAARGSSVPAPSLSECWCPVPLQSPVSRPPPLLAPASEAAPRTGLREGWRRGVERTPGLAGPERPRRPQGQLCLVWSQGRRPRWKAGANSPLGGGLGPWGARGKH